MNDELREILGDELFTELSELGRQIDEDAEIATLKALSDSQLERLERSLLQVEIPMPGDFALELVASLVHAARTGCEECEMRLASFTAEVVGHIWFALLDVLEDDFNPDPGDTTDE